MNVIEKYKNSSIEEINLDLDKNALPVALLMSQVEQDFNISTMIRNANAFGARDVYYYGRKKYDRRGACGSYHYLRVHFLRSEEEVIKLKELYYFVALDIIKGVSKPMETYQWRKNTLMMFGEEQKGLNEWERSLCEDTVHISQFGSIPSLNVGTASGIALYDFVRKTEQKVLEW